MRNNKMVTLIVTAILIFTIIAMVCLHAAGNHINVLIPIEAAIGNWFFWNIVVAERDMAHKEKKA